jgi:hypothetical protein
MKAMMRDAGIGFRVYLNLIINREFPAILNLIAIQLLLKFKQNIIIIISAQSH